jgi:hypothetical protein
MKKISITSFSFLSPILSNLFTSFNLTKLSCSSCSNEIDNVSCAFLHCNSKFYNIIIKVITLLTIFLIYCYNSDYLVKLASYIYITTLGKD